MTEWYALLAAEFAEDAKHAIYWALQYPAGADPYIERAFEAARRAGLFGRLALGHTVLTHREPWIVE